MVFSIIQKSQLEGAKRLDAEYYQPEYLFLDKIKNTANKKLTSVAQCLSGVAVPSDKFSPSGSLPVIKMTQIIGDGFVDMEGADFVRENYYAFNQKFLNNFISKKFDIAVALTGATIGKVGVVLSEALVNQRVLFCRSTEMQPAFLWILLNTKIFRNYVIRGALGGAQPNVSPEYVFNFPIPVLTAGQQKLLMSLGQESIKNYFRYKNLYNDAESLLSQELKLSNFRQSNSLSTTVNLSTALSANRFDAEYFNSPCNKILSQITKGKTAKLGDLVDMTKGIEPGAEAYQDEGKLFIRVSSVSKDGIVDKDQKYLSEDLYNEYKADYQPRKGEILLTKDATPGIACVVREPIEGVAASGVMRLKLKEKINPEYLALVLNSIVGRLQAERDAGGSIIAHWKPEQIKNLVVPILPASTQDKIADLVVKSYKARKKAKELLEEAKLKVEEMIG